MVVFHGSPAEAAALSLLPVVPAVLWLEAVSSHTAAAMVPTELRLRVVAPQTAVATSATRVPKDVSVRAALVHTLSAHACGKSPAIWRMAATLPVRSEEHTSELQSQFHLVCRLLLEKKI